MSHTQSSSFTQGLTEKVSWWWLLAVVYGFSGLVSLAYEVLWGRMLSMQFGISIFGVVLAVAAFMGGLGLGSLSGVKWAKRFKSPLFAFALLELAVAIYALLIPGFSQILGHWLGQVSSRLTFMQWYMLEGSVAICLLVIPAYAMGWGFALMLRAIDRTPLTLGKLYGINTAGGVFGALLPLWILPVLGWALSVRMVATLGVLVGIAAWIISSRAVRHHPSGQTAAGNTPHGTPMNVLLLYAGIGLSSIMLEIGWIRLYGMILLRTEYVLGVILAVFLLGIGFGSILLPQIKKFRVQQFLPIVAGVGVILSVWLLPVVSAMVETSKFQTFSGTLIFQVLILLVITAPTTLALGAWFPILASRSGEPNTAGVWLYGINCIGGVVGALLAFLIFIPYFGSVATIILAGIAITALGLISVQARWSWLGFACLVILGWHLRMMPPVHELLPRTEAGSQDLFVYEDALALNHVVRQRDGQRILLSDLQRMDASSEPSAVEIQKDQARLPLLLRPDARKVLFLGLGTGISIAGADAFPDIRITAVELSKGSIMSAEDWFGQINNNVTDRVQIVRDDARHFLESSQQNYDVIIGDLFHPDMAGMGALLSIQQFQRAKQHLNEDGLFVQWLALNQFDMQSLTVILRSFRQVFPDAVLFMDGMHLAMVGPRQELQGASTMLENLSRLPSQQQASATGKEGFWTWMGRYWGPIPPSAGDVQDEWMPYIEFKLPRVRYDGDLDLAEVLEGLLHDHPDADTAMKQLGVATEDKTKFGRTYVATELLMRGWIASLNNEGEKEGQLTWLAYQANPKDRWIANAVADNMQDSLALAGKHGLSDREALIRILDVYPDHIGALRALWHLEKFMGNNQEAERYRLQIHKLSPFDDEADRNQGSL